MVFYNKTHLLMSGLTHIIKNSILNNKVFFLPQYIDSNGSYSHSHLTLAFTRLFYIFDFGTHPHLTLKRKNKILRLKAGTK